MMIFRLSLFSTCSSWPSVHAVEGTTTLRTRCVAEALFCDMVCYPYVQTFAVVLVGAPQYHDFLSKVHIFLANGANKIVFRRSRCLRGFGFFIGAGLIPGVHGRRQASHSIASSGLPLSSGDVSRMLL